MTKTLKTRLIIFALIFTLFAALSPAISAAPQGSPKFFAVDTSTGLPLAGGKLYTYYPGTSTLKNTYTDKDFATPNTNPVVLDSRGEAQVYLQGSTKLVLKTSADVTIWTVDNVEPPSDPYEINVLMYGATGTQAAVDAAVTAISSNSRVLVFPSGDWPITKTFASNITVKMNRGARFTGTGTVTHQGEVEAGNYPIYAFTGGGKAVWSASGEPNLLWWGTNAAALNAAIVAINDGGVYATIFAPNGTYALGSTAISWYNKVSLRGQGPGTVFTHTGSTVVTDAENLYEPTADTAHYWKPIFSDLTWDIRTNANDVYVADFSYRIARRIFAENCAFLGNSAANQGVLHHKTENLANNLGLAYDVVVRNCTVSNMHSTNKPFWFEVVEGSTTAVNDLILEHIAILGVNRGCAKVEAAKQFEARHVKWYTAPTSTIDAAGTGGGINAYWEFGKEGITSEASCRDVKIEQCWHEGGSGKVIALDFTNTTINSFGPDIINSRNAIALNQVWRLQNVADRYWTAVYSNATTFTVASDITSNVAAGYVINLRGTDGNKYRTRVVSATYGAPNTTVVVEDAIVPSDLTKAYRAFDYSVKNRTASHAITSDNEVMKRKGTFQELRTGQDVIRVPIRFTITSAGTATVASVTLDEGYSYHFQADVVVWQTGGAAGTVGDSAAYTRTVGAKRLTGGAAALVGTTVAVATCEDAAMAAACDLDIDASSNDVRVRFTGDTNKNFTISGELSYRKITLSNP